MLAVCAPCALAQATPPTPPTPTALGNWMINAAAVLCIVYIPASLWLKARRTPSIDRELGELFREFASSNHAHADLVTQSQLKEVHVDCAAERTQVRRDALLGTEKLERSMDHVRVELSTKLDQIAADAEKRSSALHKRMDPLSAQVAANKQLIEHHLQDERRGRD